MARLLPRRISMHFGADDADAKFQNWRGTPDIGWELTKAMQHSEELYRIYYKSPASTAYQIVKHMFDVGNDPKASPEDEDTKVAWEQLPEAIDAANLACQHIMRAYSPDDAGAMKCLYHAESLYYSLTEAEYLLSE